MGVEDIAAKAGDALKRVSKIEVAGLLELLALLGGQYFKQQHLRLVMAQGRIVELLHFAMLAQNRRGSGGDVQIAGPLLFHQFKKGIDFGHDGLLNSGLVVKIK